MELRNCDITVIGAGLSGIAFARFYLDVHPSCELLIVEKDPCIGGVWSQIRNFDDFWAQSPLRLTAFADRPMEVPSGAATPYDTFEAKYVTQYLERYVDDHIYQGKPIRDRIWLNHEVVEVVKQGCGWRLELQGHILQAIKCSRLVVASGLTSAPNMPSFPVDTNWRAPILHHRDFGAQSKSILNRTSPFKNFTILGGGKSAADMVYAAIKAGKCVNWVVRGSGKGPGIFINPDSTGSRYRSAVERGATQNATALNPSSFHSMPRWAQALHKSKPDRELLVSKLFAADKHFKDSVNYRSRPNALESFRELEPHATFFWNNGPVGLIQHDDFWDLVSTKVHAYRNDPIGTTENSIILKDGRRVTTDILLCATGWLSNYPFFTAQQAYELGLPHRRRNTHAGEEQTWMELEHAADKKILEEFPILAEPPHSYPAIDRDDSTPARLYRGIAPIDDKSIVFLGRVRVSNNFRTADAQAIWATAYLDGNISLPNLEQMRREIAYMNTFSRRRYPLTGADGLNFHGDVIWYTDTLLSDAGMSSHRKGWWEDLDEPCLATDLKDCKSEYLAKFEQD